MGAAAAGDESRSVVEAETDSGLAESWGVVVSSLSEPASSSHDSATSGSLAGAFVEAVEVPGYFLWGGMLLVVVLGSATDSAACSGAAVGVLSLGTDMVEVGGVRVSEVLGAWDDLRCGGV